MSCSIGRAVVGMWTLLALGCAPSADDPFSRLSVYEPPTGEYRVRYLEPPWELLRSDGTTVALHIRSNAMIFGGVETGAAKFELTVTVESGTVESRIAAEQTALAGRGETLLEGPRAIRTSEGTDGQELLSRIESARTGERYFRYVYFPVDVRVVRLAFEATPSLDTAEVDAMITATGIGPRE